MVTETGKVKEAVKIQRTTENTRDGIKISSSRKKETEGNIWAGTNGGSPEKTR
ncbi:hypothetical protein [Desulfitobacterium sp.]|uniref:hypothetical protein n=1 Tax=Desulfitobacterium sp. TaxID=49981 RepID=UPI002D1A11C7|nr:hypothetical protein [Desulfitobacterium sp.]HVJ48755.1 hypothetical protein [Desulfitobacterium sp.]